MDVSFLKDHERSAWAALIAGLNGNPFHQPEPWLVGAAPGDLLYLVSRDGDRLVGAGIGLRRKASVLRWLPGGKALLLPSVPARSPDGVAAREEFYRALIDKARSEGYSSLDIEARWGEDFTGFAPFQGRLGHALIEFTVDLRPDLETLRAAMHKKHRKNLRVSMDAGLELVHDETPEGLEALRGMQQDSSERASERGNDFAVAGKGHYEELHRHVYAGGLGRVLFARKEGVNVACLAYMALGGKGVTVRSGSTRLGYDCCAMYLLQYELIRLLKERGVEELNIGGVPAEAAEPSHPQHGLYNYKRYYGGTPHLRTAVSLPLR